MTMGDEALFADLALPVVVSPILEKVLNCSHLSSIYNVINDKYCNRSSLLCHTHAHTHCFVTYLLTVL